MHPRKHMLKNLERPAGGKIVCLPEEKGSSTCETVSVLCCVPGTPKKGPKSGQKGRFSLKSQILYFCRPVSALVLSPFEGYTSIIVYHDWQGSRKRVLRRFQKVFRVVGCLRAGKGVILEKERKKRGKIGDLWSAFGSSNEKRGDSGKIVVK